jgi:hypothetical protein
METKRPYLEFPDSLAFTANRQVDGGSDVPGLRRIASKSHALPSKTPVAELTGSRRRDFAVKNLYALQGDAQVLLVSTDEAGLDFSDQ